VQIVKYPHPTLRHESKPLRKVDAELKRMVARMLELMYENNGIGLAGNQVDLPYRLFVLNLTGDPNEKAEEHVFLNPVITKRVGNAEGEEGCLSLPEVFAPVRRAERVTLTTYNLAGEQVAMELGGLFARAVQHETDHLDGVLFIDRLTPANQLGVKDRLADLEREFYDDRSRGQIPDDAQIASRLAELESLRA
jgi:peptide deformylase